MSIFSERHYEWLADFLAKIHPGIEIVSYPIGKYDKAKWLAYNDCWRYFVVKALLIKKLKEDNPNFNRMKFEEFLSAALRKRLQS